MKITRVLWLSRHVMTEDQVIGLKRIYGDVEINHISSQVTTAQEVVELGKECDVLAVVLPMPILADLVNPHNNSKPVIRAKSKRVAIGKELNLANNQMEQKYMFQHDGWEKVIKVEVVTELL